MNERDSKFDQFDELAHLPASDPARRELESKLSSMPAEERAHWESLLRETDELYAWMADVRTPEHMRAALLRMPRDPGPQPSFWRWLVFRPVPMWVPALCVLIAIGMGIYQVWPASRPAYVQSSLLDPTLAMSISRQMVAFHESEQQPQIKGNNLTKVQQVLESHKLPFPVSIIGSDGGLLALRGGGVCNLNGQPAAYTSWVGGGLTYTLVQFDGQKLGIPTSFQYTTEVPLDMWQGDKHYRVDLWAGAGGQCTWALVMENEKASDLFCMGAY